MGTVEVKQATNVNYYLDKRGEPVPENRGPERPGPEKPEPETLGKKNFRKWRIGGGIAIFALAAGAAFWCGYRSGREAASIYCDGREISTTGVVHNSKCRFFERNQVKNCDYCGGISSK